MAMSKLSFDKPTQVVFLDLEQEWQVGIAYGDEIICGCCGGIFEVDEIMELAIENGMKCGIHPYETWNNISEEISGGELPQSLKYDDNDNICEIQG